MSEQTCDVDGVRRSRNADSLLLFWKFQADEADRLQTGSSAPVCTCRPQLLSRCMMGNETYSAADGRRFVFLITPLVAMCISLGEITAARMRQPSLSRLPR